MKFRNDKEEIGNEIDFINDLNFIFDELILKKTISIFNVTGCRKVWGRDKKFITGIFLDIESCEKFKNENLESGLFWSLIEEIGFVIEYKNNNYLAYGKSHKIFLQENYKLIKDVDELSIQILKDNFKELKYYSDSRKFNYRDSIKIMYKDCPEKNIKNLFKNHFIEKSM